MDKKYFWKAFFPNDFTSIDSKESPTEESFMEALTKVAKEIGFNARSHLRVEKDAVLAVGYICEQPDGSNLRHFVVTGSKVEKDKPLNFREMNYPVEWSNLRKKPVPKPVVEVVPKKKKK